MQKRNDCLAEDVAAAQKGREETAEREDLLQRLSEEKSKEQLLNSKLKQFSDNDPAVLQEMAQEAKQAIDAANRWTDNIYSIQSWIKKKFPSVDQVICSLKLNLSLNFTFRLQWASNLVFQTI